MGPSSKRLQDVTSCRLVSSVMYTMFVVRVLPPWLAPLPPPLPVGALFAPVEHGPMEVALLDAALVPAVAAVNRGMELDRWCG